MATILIIFFEHDFNFWLADRFVLKSADLSELKQAIAELLPQTQQTVTARECLAE